MIHRDEIYIDLDNLNVEKLQYWRYRRKYDPGQRMWRATVWMLAAIMAVMLLAAQVH